MKSSVFVKHRNSALAAFLLSLLLHVCSLFYTTFYKQFIAGQQEETIVLQKKEPDVQEQEKRFEWVKTRQASGQGAPVIFQDFPDNSPSTHKNAPTSNQNDAQQKDSPIKHHDDQQVPVTPVSQEQTTIKNNNSAHAPSAHSPQQQNTATLHSSPQKRTMPSFSQLTQSMFNFSKKKGDNAVSIKGKKGIITAEQIKYEGYMHKIELCIQNAFSIHDARYPRHGRPYHNPLLEFEITRDGSIDNLRIMHTSGDLLVDAFMIFAIREASSSFPPLPNYISENKFKIRYEILMGLTKNKRVVYNTKEKNSSTLC